MAGAVEAEQVAEWLRRHDVAARLAAASAACAQERPAEPLRWLAAYMSRRADDAGEDSAGARAAAWLHDTGVSDSVARAVTGLALAQPRPSDPCAWLAEQFAAEGGGSMGAALPSRRRAQQPPGGRASPPPLDPSAGHGHSGHRRHYDNIAASPVASQPSCLSNRRASGRSSHRSGPESPRSVTWCNAADYRMGDSESGPCADDEDDDDDELEQTVAARPGGVEVISKWRAVDEALQRLRGHLLGAVWSDINDGIEEWLVARRKEGNAGLPPPADAAPADGAADGAAGDAAAAGEAADTAAVAAGAAEEEVVERGGAAPDGAAAGLRQVLGILRGTMESRSARGKICVELQANTNTGDSTVGFAEMVRQLRSMEQEFGDDGLTLGFQSFPVRRRRDDYREITTETHVLMLAKLMVTKPKGPTSAERCFEVFVNLVGHSVYKQAKKRGFDHFDVIPSFGQLVNVLQVGQHRSLCSPDSVVRCSRLVEGLHHFKLSLVRVAEHIIQCVIQGEFLTDIARRMSEAGGAPLFDPEKEERRRSLPPALPVSRRRGTTHAFRAMAPPKKDPPRRSSAPVPAAGGGRDGTGASGGA